MQWPPHSTASRGKEMGRQPPSRPETQSSSAVGLGRRLWRLNGSSGCNVSEKQERKQSLRRRQQSKTGNDEEYNIALETTERVKGNATLRDEEAHLWRVGACSRWKTMDSGRLGCRGIPVECEDSEWSQGNLQEGGNGGIWTCIYRVAGGLDVVG